MSNFLDLFIEDVSNVKGELSKFGKELKKDPKVLDKDPAIAKPLYQRWRDAMRATPEEAEKVTPEQLQQEAIERQKLDRKVEKIFRGP